MDFTTLCQTLAWDVVRQSGAVGRTDLQSIETVCSDALDLRPRFSFISFPPKV
jgi:hypothetical protein